MDLQYATSLCILIALVSTVKQISSQESPLKTVEKGQIRGRYQLSRDGRQFASFQNIPFAKQPVRFEPPEEPDSWDGVHDATRPGLQCPQVPQATNTSYLSEDCLNLNVFVPADLESYSNLTVMFWIHGGAYLGGTGVEVGPSYMMDEDIVLVTTNYRMGAFGFLNTGDELVRGNMAFKDMIMALEWVQTNIHAFGGDPTQVTLFGESAGAAAVHSLMLSPAAKGLFQKVIVQSGSALAHWNTAYKPDESFKRLAEIVNCTGSDSAVLLRCLKERPFSSIVDAQAQSEVGLFSASIDPAPNTGDYSVFPEPFENLIENGNNSRELPLIIGRNDVEWRSLALESLRDDSFVELMNRDWTAGLLRVADFSRFVHPDDSATRIGEAIREFYFNGRATVANDQESAESLEQMLSDFLFVRNIKNSVILNTKYGGNVYPYIFMYQGNFSLCDDGSEEGKRPCHADDLQYLFPNLPEPVSHYPDLEPGSEDEEFSKKLIRLWVSFARNEESVPDSTILGGEWKPIPKEKATLDSAIEWYLIQENAVSQLETERLRDRVRFWNNVFEFPLKTIDKGQIMGRYQFSRDGRKIASFEGIRFAKQPERFEPPVEPDSWSDVYDATKPGNNCPQMRPMTTASVEQSEDCLFLNVFVPAELESSTNLTVMFWVHGGAYMSGSGSDKGPKYFMDKDVVLVTTNYRVGSLGFLNTEDELVRGNMGFKDLIMALEWVQSNIHVFGGDPTQVTLFGQSAGAAAAHSLMLSPAAKGLFQKVIVQSGSALAHWNTAYKPAESFKRLAENANCTGADNAMLLRCLKERPLLDILVAQLPFAVGLFSASIDPVPNTGDYSVFPEPFEKLIEDGNNSRLVPLIMGRDDVEWRGQALDALRKPSVVALLNSNWTGGLLQLADFSRFVHPDDSVTRVAEAIREFYFNGRTSVANDEESAESLEQMLTDFDFLRNIKESVILGARYGGTIYPYTFLYQGNFSQGDPGAPGPQRPSHGDENQYLFDSLGEPKEWPDLEPGSGDDEFSRKLVNLWVSFATSEDSGPDSTILGGEWKPTPNDIASLDSAIEWYLIQENADSQLETDRLRDRVRFWNHVFEFSVKTIEKGQIRGQYQFSRDNRKFASFENIPFAKQPIRFEPPEEPDSWDDVHDATRPGLQCPQVPLVADTSYLSEDCLNLNVYVPAELESYSNLTVMFWIHGGAYIRRAGVEFGPRYIMDEDVVLVTTNYRLGVLGFLNSGDELVRGNMAFKDMIMALKWVRSNIRAFGGDPNKVTIFGESAGAAAAHSLMLSPAAKGLFEKVIVQSGSALAHWNTVYNPAESFKQLAEFVNCTGSDNSELLTCLRDRPFSSIVEAQAQFEVGPFSASIDPEPNAGDFSVFPEPFERLIENGDNNRGVPLIMGRNDVEQRSLALESLRDDSFVQLMNTNWTAGVLRVADFSRFIHPNDSVTRVAEAIREFYFNGRATVANDPESTESLEQMLSDFLFVRNVKNSVILNAKYGGKVYPFTFMYQGNFSMCDDGQEGGKRPCHADDLQYLFQSVPEPVTHYPDLEPGSEDEDFSKKFVKLWVSFARSEDGDPDSSILGGEWKPIPKEKATLDNTIEWYLIQENAVSQLETERLRDRVRFWNNVFEFPLKTIEKGQIMGRYQFSRDGRKIASFEGIRFAKQPERFEPPVEPDSWSDVYDATKTGHSCPQWRPMTRATVEQSEDCLFLNVFVPAELESYTNLTVMFWVHGGAYMGGSGSDKGPKYFMDKDVVLVTTNYRLGSLGFLNSEDGLVRGNMAFKDMIMALKWVQSNIHAFGGDPSKVTLFGESAGAAAAHSLMLSPAAKGLFQKVIVQSGSALADWNTAYKPAESFKRLAENVNCTGSNNIVLLRCLKERPLMDILVAQSSFAMGLLCPSIDPTQSAGDYSVFPEPFEKLIEDGDNSRLVPLIIGRNDVEWRGTALSALRNPSVVALLNSNWTGGLLQLADFSRSVHPNDSVTRVAEAIREFYFNGRTTVANDEESVESLEQMLTDFDFLRNIKKSVILGARYGGTIYPYTFLYQGNFSQGDPGAPGPQRPSHVDDLQYLFDSLREPKQWPDLEPGSGDDEFSRKLVNLWVSFATSEDSEPDSTILGGEWKPTPNDIASLDSAIEWYLIQENADSQVETDRLRNRVTFWNHVFEYRSQDFSAALSLSSSFVITILAGIVMSLLLA